MFSNNLGYHPVSSLSVPLFWSQMATLLMLANTEVLYLFLDRLVFSFLLILYHLLLKLFGWGLHCWSKSPCRVSIISEMCWFPSRLCGSYTQQLLIRWIGAYSIGPTISGKLGCLNKNINSFLWFFSIQHSYNRDLLHTLVERACYYT